MRGIQNNTILMVEKINQEFEKFQDNLELREQKLKINSDIIQKDNELFDEIYKMAQEIGLEEYNI